MKTNDLVKLLILVLITLVSIITHAQCVFTSTGVTSDWSLATTWSPSGCGVATIPNVSGANHHKVEINHLVSRSAGLTIIGDGSSVTINSAGTLSMGAHNLTVGNWGIPKPTLILNDGGTLTSSANVFISSGTNVGFSGAILGHYLSIGGDASDSHVNLSGNITLTNDFRSEGARIVNNTGDLTANKIVILADARFNSTAGTLESKTDFDIQAAGRAVITGGNVIIKDDLILSGAVASNFSVPTTIGRDMRVVAGADFIIGDEINVTNSVLNNGGASIKLVNNSSILTVGNTLQQDGSGHVTGIGHLSWTNFNGLGGSYVKCGGGPETQWNAPSAPTSNPLDLSICGLSILLPVEFLEFKAMYINNSVSLKWSTLSEKNNAYFSIQRSEDGISFYDINQVDGAGNSNALLEYSYTDLDVPYNGSVYYRIAQNDFDGKIMYSEIKNVIVHNSYAGQLYPNPVIEDFFYVETGDMTDMIVTVSDLSGQSVPVSFDKHNAQTIIVRFFDKPATGLYIINTISGEDVVTHRLFLN